MNIKVAAFTVSKVKYYKLYRRLELQETFPDFFFFFFAGALRVIALMVTIMRGSRGGGGAGGPDPHGKSQSYRVSY